jgi:hypothetical protein
MLDSIRHTRENPYPSDEGHRKTIGNIPDRLHAELQKIGIEHNLRLHEVVATLLHFSLRET